MTTTAAKTDTLAAAFLKAQSKFPIIGKDSEADAGSFKYKYASLPVILRVCLPVLHEHGFSLSQTFRDGMLVTRLIHDAGEMTSEIPCSPIGLKPQDFGALVSYMRRYAFISITGIAPDDDPDAAGLGATPPPPPAPTTPASIHDITARRLITDDRELVKAWSIAELTTEAEALRAVGDFLGALDADPGDDLYTIAKSALNCVVDERNANA
jgi:hypothetical protein